MNARTMGNPRDPMGELYHKDKEQSVRFVSGIVVDTGDPDRLGRIKVHLDRYGDTVITGWIYQVRPFSGTAKGAWTPPQLNEQVVLCCIGDNPDNAVCLGTFYDPAHKPPVAHNKGNHRKMLISQSGSTILIDDTPGAERIEAFMKDGEMRILLDKNQGIEIANDAGDIEIESAGTLTIEGDETGAFDFKEGFVIEAGENIEYTANKGIEVLAEKNIQVKGKKINVDGSTGVQSEGKQIAMKDDQVVGNDIHIVMVPSNSGRTPVPLPHPYMGTMTDKLSPDVAIKGKPAATQGSVSTHSQGHRPTPPGRSFQRRPSNKGEVVLGTSTSLKINGKNAALMGSTVKTCADPADAPTSQIVSPGVAAMFAAKLPATKVPGRAITDLRWERNRATVGDAVLLKAQLKEQYENATVTFNIYEAGKTPGKDKPVRVLTENQKGGRAEVPWSYEPLDDDTSGGKFFATASSFGCELSRSAEIQMLDRIEVACVEGDDPAQDILECEISQPDGTTREGVIDGEGMIVIRDLVPGKSRFRFVIRDDEE